jgi:hypothetical protein
VESLEIGFERRLRFEEDVEADKIAGRPEIFRRGIIHVADECPWIFRLHRAVKTRQEALDALWSVPSDDWRWNLVSDRVGQDRRMTGALAHTLADVILD